MRRRPFHLFLIGIVHLCGCASPQEEPSPTVSQVQAQEAERKRCIEPRATLEGPPLTPFRDAAELERFLVAATTQCRSEFLPPGASPQVAASMLRQLAPERTTQASSSGAQGHDGAIDEQWSAADGTIARRGELLFVLRDRVVTVVDVSAQGAPREVDVQAVPTHGDSRYDGQLRVIGEHVYVIETSADFGRRSSALGLASPKMALFVPPPPRAMHTHITTFVMRGGKLTLAGGTLIEHSRMRKDILPWVRDGELVLPLVHKLIGDFKYDPATGLERGSMRMSRVLHRASTGGPFVPKGPLFSASDVYRPLDADASSIHSVARCQTAPDGQLACSAKAFTAPGLDFRTLLKTDDRLYLAADDDRVYAVSLTDFDVTAHRMSGFAEGLDAIEREGVLHFPVLEDDHENQHGQVLMWSIPRTAFDKRGEQPASGRRVLAEWHSEHTSIAQHGFIGSTYIGHVISWVDDVRSTARLVYDVATPAPAQVETLSDGPGAMVTLEGGRVAFLSERYPEPENYELAVELWALKPHLTLQSQLVLPAFRADARGTTQVVSPQNGDAILAVPALVARELAFVRVADGKLGAIGRVAIEYDFDRCRGGCFEGPMLSFRTGDRTFMLAGAALVEIALTPAAAAIGQTYTLRRLD